MTEKRFKEIISTQKVIDTQTGKEYDCLLDNDFYDLINEIAEENEQSKKHREELFYRERDAKNDWRKLKYENEQLKATMQEVAELLSEGVDLFSDKATEHDINAYIELTQLDNKDAYYMAVTTKKAIKMLKGDERMTENIHKDCENYNPKRDMCLKWFEENVSERYKICKEYSEFDDKELSRKWSN